MKPSKNDITRANNLKIRKIPQKFWGESAKCWSFLKCDEVHTNLAVKFVESSPEESRRSTCTRPCWVRRQQPPGTVTATAGPPEEKSDLNVVFALSPQRKSNS
jgi:hypothetical protein